MEFPIKEKACKVFWDYENCPKPKEYDFETVFSSIRNQLECLGLEIRGYNIYCDESCLGSTGRQDLQDLGCAVINPSKVVGSKRKQETVDFRMAIDISMFAVERAQNPSTTCMVVITSDTDFGYLLGQLRNKGYSIFLMYNKTVHSRLAVHAHRQLRLYDVYVSSSAEDDPVLPNHVDLKSLEEINMVRDDVSVATLESESWTLRLHDLVDIVTAHTAAKGKRRIADGTVGGEFMKKFPALKNYYRAIKDLAVKEKLLKIEKDPEKHNCIYLLLFEMS